jgi:hypothetical protein
VGLGFPAVIASSNTQASVVSLHNKENKERDIMMSLKTGLLVLAAVGLGWLPVHAADVEMQVVDKNCWIEIFEDDNFDADDPHVKLQGPKEYATLKNLAGKDWSTDIESVIVGSNTTVHAYEDKDFKGTELSFTPGQRVPNLGKLDMANDIESMKIACGR